MKAKVEHALNGMLGILGFQLVRLPKPLLGLQLRSNLRLIKQYISLDGPKKLHLGCGPNVLPGWLNTDIVSSDTIAYLDLTERFPFEDGTFDYVLYRACHRACPICAGDRDASGGLSCPAAWRQDSCSDARFCVLASPAPSRKRTRVRKPTLPGSTINFWAGAPLLLMQKCT